MHIKDSTSAKVRYGECAVGAFHDADVLWEESEGGYSGMAALVFRLPDGRFGFYEWWYGSCSGCDDWEARELSDAQIADEMLARAAFFASRNDLLGWLDMTGASDALSRPKRSVIEPLLASASAASRGTP